MPNQDEELWEKLENLYKQAIKDNNIPMLSHQKKKLCIERINQAIFAIKQWAIRKIGEDEDTEYSGLTYGDTNLDLTAVNYGKNEAKKEIRQRIERS